MQKVVFTSLVIAAALQLPSLYVNAGSVVNKDSANYYLQIARTEQDGRKYSNAWKYYEKAANFDATNADAQKGIADVCLKMNKMAPAIKALEAYYSMRPTDNDALQQMVKLYFNFGSYDKVITLAPELHKRVPSDKGYAFMLGKAYYSQQNYGQAQKYMEEATKLEPENAEAYYMIGHMYTMMSNYNAGIPYYRKALELDSVTSNQVRLYEFALVLSTATKFDESISVFEKALSKGYKPRDDFYMNFAYTLADAHQSDKAVRMLDEMLSRRPSDLGVLEALADVCYHSGKFKQAIGYWDKMLAIDDHNARVLYQIGMCYIKMGNENDGHALCDKAISMDPSLQQLRQKKSGIM